MSYLPILEVKNTINAKGAYSASVTYNMGDSVSYNGSSYMAMGQVLNVLPTDATRWQLLSQKGDTGTTIEGAFTDLTDAPANYIGKAKYHVRVNATADGVDFEPLQANAFSTGLYSGGLITINADTTKFDISAGTGVVVDNHTNPDAPLITNIVWGNITALVTPYLATDSTTFIGIDASSVMHYKNEDFTQEEKRSIISIGWVDHPGNDEIIFARTEPQYSAEGALQISDLMHGLGQFNITGNDYLAHTGLTLKRTAGTSFDDFANYETEASNPHIITSALDEGCDLIYYYRNGAGGWVNDTPTVTNIDPDHYDDGTGTLATVPTGKWTIQIISLYPIPGWIGNDIQYGQVVYDAYRDAKIALQETVELNPYNSKYDLYRTYMVVKQGATDLTTHDQVDFYNAGKFGLFGNGDIFIDQETIMSEEEFTLARLQNFCGLIDGGLISIATGNTTLDITAGTSSYADYSDPLNPVIEILAWPAQNVNPGLSVSIPRVWIGIERISHGVGEIVFSTSFTGLQKRRIAVIGRAWGNGTSTITGRGQYTTTAYYQTNTMIDLIRALGSLNRDGNVFVPNGANLLLDKSSGNSFRFTANYLAQPDSPNSIVNPTMTGIASYQYHIYNDTVIHIETDIDPEYYDLAGTKTAVPTGKFTVQRIYYFPVSNVVDVLYGQAYYNTLAEALAAAALEQVQIDDLNLSTLDGAILRAYLVVQQGTTELNDAAKASLVSVSNLGAGGGSSGVVGITDHNDLENMQGGTTAEYYHITAAEHTVVGNTSGTNTGDSATPAETTSTIGALINGATTKATPINADLFGFADTEASNILKKLTWANIKSVLKTYFDTLYASSSYVRVFKATDETRTSNATITVDSDLVFPMLANTKYTFEMEVYFDTTAAADFKYRHTGPASPTVARIHREHIIPAATAYIIAVDSAFSAADVTMAGTGTTGGYIRMTGVIHNGANAGNFSFAWAQNTSTAVNTTVLAGSWLKYIAL